MANFLNTRIRLKYDSFSNWITNDPELLAGEIAIVVPGTDFGNENQKTSVASCLIKVGNGSAKFSELPWLSAVAADVHLWAKLSNAEFKAWMEGTTTIEGMTRPALATSQELATLQAQVTAIDGRLSDAEDAIELLNNNAETEGSVAYAVAQEQARAEEAEGNLQDAIDILNGGVDVEGSVAKAVKTAVDAEKDAREAAFQVTNANVGNNTTAITTLIGNVEGDNAKSVRAIAIEEVANVVNSAPEAFDTLKEVADWITNDETGAAAMAADIAALEETVGGLRKDVDDNVGAIGAIEGNVSNLQERVQTLEEEMDTAQSDIADLKAAVGENAEGLASKISALTGRVDTAENDIDAVEGRLDTAEAAIDTLQKTAICGALSEADAAGNQQLTLSLNSSELVFILDCGSSSI